MREWTPPAAEDSHDDPAKLRAGYGNASQHVWWPLTAPELAALEGASRAREGDAHALLALAIDTRCHKTLAGLESLHPG